jgi:hypothetical protein
MMARERLEGLVQDVALLQSLGVRVVLVLGRGLHSFTSQLNFSFLWDRGARRDCVARVKGV